RDRSWVECSRSDGAAPQPQRREFDSIAVSATGLMRDLRIHRIEPERGDLEIAVDRGPVSRWVGERNRESRIECYLLLIDAALQLHGTAWHPVKQGEPLD